MQCDQHDDSTGIHDHDIDALDSRFHRARGFNNDLNHPFDDLNIVANGPRCQ